MSITVGVAASAIELMQTNVQTNKYLFIGALIHSSLGSRHRLKLQNRESRSLPRPLFGATAGPWEKLSQNAGWVNRHGKAMSMITVEAPSTGRVRHNAESAMPGNNVYFIIAFSIAS